MQIDWITVGAQIVNFLVLVWLLKRFLYGPVTLAMERREKRIRDHLLDAERQKQAAEVEASRYRERQDELERRSGRMLAEARQSADEERRMLEREAREEVEKRKRDWLLHLEGEREAFFRELRRRSSDQFFELARRALSDLGNAGLEAQIAAGFVGRLEELDQDERDKLAAGCEAAGGNASIRSRFDLPSEVRRQITRAFRQAIGSDARLDYETSSEVSCGIELKAGSQTVSWNLDSYLDGLEKAVGDQLGTHPQTGDGAGDR